MISSHGNNQTSTLAVSSQISTTTGNWQLLRALHVPTVVNLPAQLFSIEVFWVH